MIGMLIWVALAYFYWSCCRMAARKKTKGAG